MFHKLHVLGMNDDLWDRVRGLGSEIQLNSVAELLGPRNLAILEIRTNE